MNKKLLRLRTVEDYTGLSRSSIYRMIKAGEFPAPIQLTGSRSVAWLAEEIDTWIKSRISESRGGDAK